MKDNLVRMAKRQPLQGFILPFEDHPATATMHASVALPLSMNTAMV
jgi:phospholipase D1/2